MRTVSRLFKCLACGAHFDCEGHYREGYEPGEVEFVPLEEECPECERREIEAA